MSQNKKPFIQASNANRTTTTTTAANTNNGGIKISKAEHEVLARMAKLWANRSSPSEPDIQPFETADKVIVNGHSCILSIASPILAAAIQKVDRKDKDQKKSIQKSPIVFRDVDSTTLTEVFRWIYTGRVKDLQKHQTSLLVASEMFLLHSLRALCVQSISQSLPPEQAHYHLTRMPLNNLPDLCLLMVFDRLPVNDLFTLSTVCKRWRSLLKSACIRRKTLTILGSNAREALHQQPNARSPLEMPYHHEALASEGYDRDQLELPEFCTSKKLKLSINRELFGKVAAWFPGLTRLRLGFVGINRKTLAVLGAMLSTKTQTTISQLTSLSLNLKLNAGSVLPENLSDLFRSLEKMDCTKSTKLTELCLICEMLNPNGEPHFTTVHGHMVQPPVIGTLHSLTYHCPYPFDVATFKESVRTRMPSLTSLAVYCPSLANPPNDNILRQYLRPLSDLRTAQHGLEPYRGLMSGPTGLPEGVWSNFGHVFKHQPSMVLQGQFFTGLKSLKLQVQAEKDHGVVDVMATLADSLCHSLEYLKLDFKATSYFTFTMQQQQQVSVKVERPSTSKTMITTLPVPFRVLSVLELKLAYALPLDDPYVPPAAVLAKIAPRLRVLTLEGGWCPLDTVGKACLQAGKHNSHVPCIRPMMDGFSDGSSLPELRRLMVRLESAKNFEHWTDVVASYQASIKRH